MRDIFHNGGYKFKRTLHRPGNIHELIEFTVLFDPESKSFSDLIVKDYRYSNIICSGIEEPESFNSMEEIVQRVEKLLKLQVFE